MTSDNIKNYNQNWHYIHNMRIKDLHTAGSQAYAGEKLEAAYFFSTVLQTFITKRIIDVFGVFEWEK